MRTAGFCVDQGCVGWSELVGSFTVDATGNVRCVSSRCATRLCHPKALLRAYPGVAWHLPEAINLSLLIGEKCGRYSDEV